MDRRGSSGDRRSYWSRSLNTGRMTLNVFISHSVGKTENPIVHHLSASLTGAGVPNYLAMYDRRPGVRLSEKVKAHITDSRVLIALLTKGGDESSWVHDEIGYALGKGLRVVALLEKSLKLDGMHEGAEYFSFDPANPGPDIAALSERLARERAEEEAEAAKAELAGAQAQLEAMEVFAVVMVCIAVVAVVLLAAKK